MSLYYKHFLRLNNRRKQQYTKDFIAAGYPYIVLYKEFTLPSGTIISVFGPKNWAGWADWAVWMDNSIGKYSYFKTGNKVFFENKELLILHQMRWG